MNGDYVEKTEKRSLGMKKRKCLVVCQGDKRSASTNTAMVHSNDSFMLLVAGKQGFFTKNNDPW